LRDLLDDERNATILVRPDRKNAKTTNIKLAGARCGERHACSYAVGLASLIQNNLAGLNLVRECFGAHGVSPFLETIMHNA
jgi:hypothetical protein